MADTVPILTTERLILRPWRESDLAPFAALNADPAVMEHFPATMTAAETAALVESTTAAMAERGFGWWAAEVPGEIGRATSELQSLMRISYAVFCLKKKIRHLQYSYLVLLSTQLVIALSS